MKKEPTFKQKQEKKAYKYKDNIGYQVFMCFQVMTIIDIAHDFVETNLSKYIFLYLCRRFTKVLSENSTEITQAGKSA